MRMFSSNIVRTMTLLGTQHILVFFFLCTLFQFLNYCCGIFGVLLCLDLASSYMCGMIMSTQHSHSKQKMFQIGQRRKMLVAHVSPIKDMLDSFLELQGL